MLIAVSHKFLGVSHTKSKKLLIAAIRREENPENFGIFSPIMPPELQNYLPFVMPFHYPNATVVFQSAICSS